MKFKKLSILKYLTLVDYLSIFTIILGLVLIFVIEETAIKLIGISISIIGLLYLIVTYPQKWRNIRTPISQPGMPPPKYTTKTTTDSEGIKRTQFEYSADSGYNIEEHEAENSTQANEISSQQGLIEESNSSFKILRFFTRTESEETEKANIEEKIINNNKNVDILIENENISSIDSELVKPTCEEVAVAENNIQNVNEQILIKEDARENELTDVIELSSKEEKLEVDIKSEVIEKEFTTNVEPQKSRNFEKVNIGVESAFLLEGLTQLPKDPRKEFQILINLILKSVRSISNTQFCALFIVNADTQELILEANDSSQEISQYLKPTKRFKLSNDIASQIFINGKPEIITGIEPSAELDLFPFFTHPVGIVSFIGIPVFYRNKVIGILCACSKEYNAYDSVTVNFLSILSKLINNLLQSYDEKNELFQSQKIITAINRFQDLLENHRLNEESLMNILIEAVSKVCNYSTIGICIYNSSVNSWVVRYLKTKDPKMEVLENKKVNLDLSLVGKALKDNDSIVISSVPSSTIRICDKEPEFSDGFFVVIPLKSPTHIYGALFIDGKKPSDITNSEVKIIESLCNFTGLSFEEIYLNNYIEENAIIDPNTGLYNYTAFTQRLEEEIYRAREMKSPLALCIFQIDKYSSYNPTIYVEKYNLIVNHIIEITQKHLRPHFVFGRIDKYTFGVILFFKEHSELKFWAEKLRSEIAISPVSINNYRVPITISIGISEFKNCKNINELVNNTKKALEIAKKRTNCVIVYN